SLAHAARYAEWRRQPRSAEPHFEGLRRDEARAIVARALSRGPGWLAPAEVRSVLECYGITCVEERLAGSPSEASAIAGGMEMPVALKRSEEHTSELQS